MRQTLATLATLACARAWPALDEALAAYPGKHAAAVAKLSSGGPSASTSPGAGARPSTAAARGCAPATARRGLERQSTWEGNELNTIMN